MKKSIKLSLVVAALLVNNTFAKDITPPQIDSNSTFINSVEDNLGNTYMVYNDGSLKVSSNGGTYSKGQLLKYDDISWSVVNSSITDDNSTDINGKDFNKTEYFTENNLSKSVLKVDTNNSIHMLYIQSTDSTNVLSYQKYNASLKTWEYGKDQFNEGLNGVGSNLPLANDITMDINSSNTPIVAYIDSSNNSVVTKYLNTHNTDIDTSDDTWDTLGTPGVNSNLIDLVIDNDRTYLAYIENTGGKVSVMRYENGAWNTFDSNISSGVASNIDLYVADDNNLYLSYVNDGTSPKVAKLRRYTPTSFAEENTTTISQVVATNNTNIVYTLTGNDKDKFSITNDGNLSFTNPLSFETIEDNSSNGIYEVTVNLKNSDTNLTTLQHFNVTLTDINDAPTASNISITIDEDHNKTFVLNDFNFTDEDTLKNGDALQSIYISTLPTKGTLQLDNTDVVVNQEINKSVLSNLVYVPVLNGNGVAYTTFGFKVNDGKLNSDEYIATVNVSAVDDIQVLQDIQAQVNDEDNASTKIDLLSLISDVDKEDNVSNTVFTANTTSDIVDLKIVNNELILIPKADANGETTIELNATLNGKTVSTNFTYTLNSVNDTPKIEAIADLNYEKSTTNDVKTISFDISDDKGIVSLDSVSKSSSLISNITTVNDDNKTGTLNFTVLANQTGTETITIKATDEHNATYFESFNVSVAVSDTEKCVEDVTTALTFDTIKGDNSAQNYITSNLSLKSSLDTICADNKITWSSSDTNATTNEGVVTEGKIEKTISLTATISKDTITSKKEFLLTIAKAVVTNQEVMDKVTFTSIKNKNDRKTNILSDLTLLTTILDKNITWSSTSPSVIDPYTGVVSRAGEDKNVTLTAKIDENTSISKEFNLTVPASIVNTLQQLSADSDWLTFDRIIGANKSSNNIKANLTKPLPSIAPNGSTITWSSSNTSVISDEGDVFRDDKNDKNVKLTATITSSDGTSTLEKEFMLKVNENVVVKDNNTTFKSIDSNDTSVAINFTKGVNNQEVKTKASFSESLKNSIERIISFDSIKTIIDVKDKILNMFLNTDGTTQSSSEFKDENNKTVVSSVQVDIPESNTVVDENGTVNTDVQYDTNTTFKAELNQDGTVSHKVEATDTNSTQTTTATSKIKGSTVAVKSNGEVETTSQKTVGEMIIQAIVTSSKDGTTKTKFVTINLATGEETDLANTIKDAYEAGNQVEISEINGTVYIKTQTPLNNNIIVE